MQTTRTKTTSKAVFALAVALFVAAGCGNYSAEKSAPVRPESESTPPESDSKWVLSVVDSNTYSVPKGQSTHLRVQLADPDEGVQADEVVHFEIPGTTKGSTIASRRAKTDGDGIASMEFRAGPRVRTVSVRANHDRADPLELHVDIQQPQPGTLEVAFEQPSAHATPLKTTEARLFPSDTFSCSAFQPLGDVKMGAETKSAASPNERVAFEELDAQTKYTVVARSQNQAGLPAAAGCKDAIEIKAGDKKKTTIDLDYLPLDPAGTYELTSTWDLSSFVDNSSPFGDRIQEIIGIVADPAGAFLDRIAKEIEQRTSDLVAYVVKNSSVASDIKDAINQRLRESGLPDKLRGLASSLRRTIDGLEIRGQLTVSERGKNAKVTGTHAWSTAYVQPPKQCSNSSSPACDKQKIELRSEVADGLSAEWSGGVESYNELSLDQHIIRVDAGDLATKILQKIIIPRMTDGAATTLEGAIKHWFDCGGLAADLVGSGSLCVSDVCIDESTVAGACNAMLTGVLDLENFAGELLNINVAVEVNGTGQMTERTDAGRIQSIEEGSFQGAIRTIGERTTAPADATWTAERQSSTQ